MADKNENKTKTNIHANHRQRLRKRFEESGIFGMEEHVVLELLLTYVIPRRDTNPTAHLLADRFGNLYNVLSAPYGELIKVDGVGPATANFLNMLSVVMGEAYSEAMESHRIDSRGKAGMYFTMKLLSETTETVIALYLDREMRFIASDVLSRDESFGPENYVDAVLDGARKYRAANVILGHNHIGGPLKPSSADQVLHFRITEECEKLGVRVRAHIITCGFDYVFFASDL